MKRPQRGVAIVEFALILPMLLILTFITTEFGRALYQYNTLAKSVRDGARYLSFYSPGSAQRIEEARNLIIYGTITTGSEPLTPGLRAEHVPDPTWQPTGTNPVVNVVTVRVVNYSFQSMFPTTAFGQPFGPITFPAITASMRTPP